jgi:hypothetical protein
LVGGDVGRLRGGFETRGSVSGPGPDPARGLARGGRGGLRGVHPGPARGTKFSGPGDRAPTGGAQPPPGVGSSPGPGPGPGGGGPGARGLGDGVARGDRGGIHDEEEVVGFGSVGEDLDSDLRNFFGVSVELGAEESGRLKKN